MSVRLISLADHKIERVAYRFISGALFEEG